MKNTSIKKQFVLIIGLSLLIQALIVVLFLLFSNYQHYKDSSDLAYQEKMKATKAKVKREVLQLYNVIDFEIANYKKDVKRDIKNRVYEAYDIAWSIFNKYKNKKSLDEIKKLIIASLKDIRFFNGRGYYFIDDMQGNVVMYPIRPNEAGKSYLNVQDTEGKYVIREFLKKVRNSYEGFVNYKTYAPEKHTPSVSADFEKVSFVKLFEPFNWVIGAGDYSFGNLRELRHRIINLIDNRRYGKDGYFFAYDYEGKCLNLPPDRSMESTNMLDYKDVNGKPVIKDALDVAEKGGGFMKWHYKTMDSRDQVKKIGYIKGLKKLNIWFGTGIYFNEISAAHKNLQNQYKTITTRNSAAIIATLLIVYLIIYILTRNLVSKLGKEIDSVGVSFDNAVKNDQMIPDKTTKMEELQKLIQSFNNTMKEKQLFNRIAKEKEKQFSSMFEKSAEPMLILNTSGFVDCNKAAVNFLGYTQKEDILKHPAELSPEEQMDGKEADTYKHIIEELYKTKGVKSFEWIHLKSDGSYVFVAVILTFIENQNFILCTWRDITKRITAENDLISEKNKLITMLESIKDAVVIVNMDSKVTYLNSAFTEITGYTKSDIISKNFDDIISFYDIKSGKADAFKTSYVLSTSRSYKNLQGQKIITKNGVEKIISRIITPIKNNEGGFTGAVISLRDITESITYQQKKAKYESLHSIAILTGSLAHDFNNILTGILTNAYLARKFSDNEKVLRFIQKIESAVSEATETTNNMLKYTESGDLLKNPTHLPEIVEDTCGVVFAGHDIKVRKDFSDYLWSTEIDRVKISQALNSIFVNIKDAVKDSNVEINIKIFNTTNEEDGSFKLNAGEYVRLEISVSNPKNNHVSFKNDKIEDKSSIALLHAQSIIANHGGVLKYETGEQNLNFTVLLPAFQDKRDIKDIKTRRSNHLNLLIVDNEEITRESLKKVMEFLGHNVSTADSYTEALEMLQNNEYDFAVIDYMTEDKMDIVDFLKNVNEFLGDNSVVIACKSPRIEADDKIKNDSKVISVIYKPFKMDEIANLIKIKQ